MTSSGLVDLVAGVLADAPAAPAPPASPSAALTVSARLGQAAERARDLGLPVPPLSGQLLRPRVVLAGARLAGVEPDDRLWLAALAIQLAHEASLLHDDVIDGAAIRRGARTTVERHGVARALVEGDHLLTAAYRVAAETGSLEFARSFADAVEATVAGEKQQAAARGSRLDWDRYLEVVGGKSGALFGCALSAGSMLAGRSVPVLTGLGRRVGSIYQMVDDLLDYCPAAATGKPALGDFRGSLWTWVRAFVPELAEDAAEDELRLALFGSPDGRSPMRRALRRLRDEMDALLAALRAEGDDGGTVTGLLDGWFSRAEQAVAHEEMLIARADAEARIRRLSGGRALASAADWESYFAEHGRTFRFAARLFPATARTRVAAVYAFCRLTDDLVDRQPDLSPGRRHRLLDAWHAAARCAYDGGESGIPLLQAAMRDMRTHRVPFRHAADLIAGARMDLDPVTFDTMDDLRLYTHRVASVVGLWLTELFGVHDPAVLDRAAAMGHAMQLTNILRDVGEDLERGRLYLPASLLRTRGLERADLEMIRGSDAPVPAPYAALCEELLALAERQYAYAFEALPALPGFFRRPVAVAARAYEGIHGALRRNGYDNLRRRAHTTVGEKVVLGARGLRDLWLVRARQALDGQPGIAVTS